MRITDLRKGDRIECCGIEHTVHHIALHPSSTVIITEDEAALSAVHLNKHGWSVVGVKLSEFRPPASLDRAVDSLFAASSAGTARERLAAVL